MQSHIWRSTVSLWITHPSSVETSIPYIVHIPRLSYLPLLLPRLQSQFHDPSIATFTYEGIHLKNLPVGLLVDLYRPDLPWRLEVAEGFAYDIRDAWMNSVKEVSVA